MLSWQSGSTGWALWNHRYAVVWLCVCVCVSEVGTACVRKECVSVHGVCVFKECVCVLQSACMCAECVFAVAALLEFSLSNKGLW